MLSWIKKNYHWVIALVILLELGIYGGLSNNYTSLYLIPVTEDFGISRSSFSLALSMKYLVSAICTAGSSVIFLRFGTKKPLLLCLAGVVVAYVLLSASTGLSTFVFVSILLGGCDAIANYATASRVIGDWFHRFQGAVLGLVTASTGLGGGLLCSLLSNSIQSHGWRASYLVSAVLVILAMVLVLLFLREKPSAMGLKPYGMGYSPKKKKRDPEDSHWLGYTMQELLRKPSFYLAALTFFLASLCVYLVFSAIMPHLQGQGMSASEAAAQNSMMLIFLAVFKFLYGALSDAIGPKWAYGICLVCGAVGLWLLSAVTNPTIALIGVAFYSMGLPTVTVLIPLLTYPLFGYQSHNATLGIFLAIPTLGLLIGSPIANAVHDRIGSYTPVFQFSAILCFVVLGLLILLSVITQKDRKKYEEEA